jgi:hypothetical protein
MVPRRKALPPVLPSVPKGPVKQRMSAESWLSSRRQFKTALGRYGKIDIDWLTGYTPTRFRSSINYN